MIRIKTTSQTYAIENSVMKRLKMRYRDIDPRDISKLINALLSDISMFDGIEKKHEMRVKDLEKRYENLLAIKINSGNPVLFPHQKSIQKQKSLEAMQLKKVKYLEELLKKDELEIAQLKDLTVSLKNVIANFQKGV